MIPLLDEYVRQAESLPRAEAEVYQSIRSWVVAEAGGRIIAMGSLVVLWHDLAEIRSRYHFSLPEDAQRRGHNRLRFVFARASSPTRSQ